ncbi:MAG: arsenate reductase [Halocynthiibacter sp.]|jgi:DNA-binding transcriptional ArsR family regulator
MEQMIPNQLTCLGHPQRLAVFRMLMRCYPEAAPAGEIAAKLDIKASTLSVYLSALRTAGLIEQARVGTSLRYTARVKTAQDLVQFLFDECCTAGGGANESACLPPLCFPTETAK